jgi:hypothetical protein
MNPSVQKQIGAYYTPDAVVRSLVRWAARRESDRMLDPACGDGRFLVEHANSVGVEQDPGASAIVHARTPGCLIHEGDFFAWASVTKERFECAAGNPPFIRYQRFTGKVRGAALGLCARQGVDFSALSSSWAPFVVATAGLLKPGGRMAFVVPAEIGHATYAKPLLEYLVGHFAEVQIVAVRERLFPELSEDCWLLYAEGFGGRTDQFRLSALDRFHYSPSPPRVAVCVNAAEWRSWRCRLRSFLLPAAIRSVYWELGEDPHCATLGQVADVGIGYVTGANDFFHLRPSAAGSLGIPPVYLCPSVRSGRLLSGRAVTASVVEEWRRRDDPMLLLRIRGNDLLPASLRSYLSSPAGREAAKSYKCRNRNPWYVVPDVVVPDAFLSYMCGQTPALVANQAGCACTNSVHAVVLSGRMGMGELQRAWGEPITALSCELEGHPLGGGMLKMEPREAGRILLSRRPVVSAQLRRLIDDGIEWMRRWRHYG